MFRAWQCGGRFWREPAYEPVASRRWHATTQQVPRFGVGWESAANRKKQQPEKKPKQNAGKNKPKAAAAKRSKPEKKEQVSSKPWKKEQVGSKELPTVVRLGMQVRSGVYLETPM